MRGRAVVIPTRDRPQAFARCLAAVGPQVDLVVVVAHMNPGYVLAGPRYRTDMLPYQEDPPNISRMWNLGLQHVASVMGAHYDVAVLNDDAIVPPDWFQRVTDTMHTQHAAAGCVRRPTDHRMTGYAFILDGDKHLYADEQFQWWWGDTDLQRQAEQVGGVAFAAGPDVEHLFPNSTTVGELAEIAGEDRQRFAAKWGQVPF